MNNRKTEIETCLAAISIRTKQLFDFEIRNESYLDASSVKAECNSLYLEAIDLEDELEALPVEANPNRFIKSSFTLSLLWVAKFYASLEAEYKGFSSQATKAANCALDAYSALSWAIEPNGYLEDSAPITFDYLCFSC